MAPRTFSDLLNHEVEQKTGTLEKFYEENVFQSTRRHVMRELLKRVNDKSLDCEAMGEKGDWFEVTDLINKEAKSFMTQNDFILT